MYSTESSHCEASEHTTTTDTVQQPSQVIVVEDSNSPEMPVNSAEREHPTEDSTSTTALNIITDTVATSTIQPDSSNRHTNVVFKSTIPTSDSIPTSVTETTSHNGIVGTSVSEINSQTAVETYCGGNREDSQSDMDVITTLSSESNTVGSQCVMDTLSTTTIPTSTTKTNTGGHSQPSTPTTSTSVTCSTSAIHNSTDTISTAVSTKTENSHVSSSTLSTTFNTTHTCLSTSLPTSGLVTALI